MENNKIKVVWICHLSNSDIRRKLKFRKWSLSAILKHITKKNVMPDFAVWNTNAIREIERFGDIDLHIIAPHNGINGIQYFKINGVSYYFFRDENDNMLSMLMSHVFKKNKKKYEKNSKIINSEIARIQPDIVHLIGAENPYYSESVLSLSEKIPLIVSLQTLMSDPDFIENYPIDMESYIYRSGVELKIIKRADYVATNVEHFRSIIRDRLNNIKFLDMRLAVGEEAVVLPVTDKEYDFVYYAANISKAVDYAIEAFAIVKRKYKDITLHVVGGYDDTIMTDISHQLEKLEIYDGIDFTGKLPTYNDVINEIRKAHFALIPLKIDMISGTIRESMANGLPVITTITPATPNLNVNRKSVLLSEKGDYEAMADNMCKLLEDNTLAETLRMNGLLTVQEMFDNKSIIESWRENYHAIVSGGDISIIN